MSRATNEFGAKASTGSRGEFLVDMTTSYQLLVQIYPSMTRQAKKILLKINHGLSKSNSQLIQSIFFSWPKGPSSILWVCLSLTHSLTHSHRKLQILLLGFLNLKLKGPVWSFFSFHKKLFFGQNGPKSNNLAQKGLKVA